MTALVVLTLHVTALFRPYDECHMEPFPYCVWEKALPHDLYSELERDFPATPEAVRTGKNHKGNKSIRRIDAAYEELLSVSHAWRRLDRFVHSQEMLDFGMKIFGHMLANDPACKLDPAKVVFVDANETLSTRDPKTGAYTGGGIDTCQYYERRRTESGDPHKMYTVMDFFHGAATPIITYTLAPRIYHVHS